MDGLDEVQDKDTDSSSSSSSDDSPEFEEHSPPPESSAHTPSRSEMPDDDSDQPAEKKKKKKGQTAGSSRKKDPASLKTLRFHIQLDADIEAGEGGEEDKYEFNWLDLIAEENERKESKVDDGHMGGNNFGGAALDPYASDDDEQLRALARKFENKYGAEDVKKKKKARKLDDYADLGYGYDSNDPFIDNSEVHDEIVPANLTTAHGGFYVNIGALEFKTRESADEDSDVEAIINEGEKAEKKRKYIKKKETTSLNGLPDEPPAKKKKVKRIQNPDGTTSLIPINGGHSSHDDPTGASASGSMDEGDGRPKKPRIRREGAKPLGRPKKRNPDGSLVHPPKMPKAKRPGFETNGSAGRHKVSPNHINDSKILKNKKGRSVMKVNTPGSFANSSNSTSVVDLTDGDERLTPKSQKNATECNDDVVKLLQSVSDQVGKKLTAGEAASTSYKGVTITPTAAGSKPKKSGCTTPNVSLVATSTSSGGSKAKPASAVTVKKLLEEQNHQQKAKNQTPQPIPVKRKPSSAASNTQALQHQKKKQQQQLQQQLAQQQQQDLMNYLTALAAYQQAGSPSGKNSTNAELLSALAGLSASGTMTPELYAQLLATQGQMNDVLLQQFAASFYPTSASLSAFTTSSGTSRKGSVSGSSSATIAKQVSSSLSKAKTTVTNSSDRKLPSSTSSPSPASSASSVVVSSLSSTVSSGLAQAAASAAAATKAKHSSAHSIESLSKSSLQGTKAGQSLLVSKQGISQNAAVKGSVQVVSTSGTKPSPTINQVTGGSKVGNKSLTKSGADIADSPGSTSVLKTASPTPTVPATTLSSQQQQLLRQEQFEAEQKEFAQFELMAQAKFEREEIERLKADQEKRMKMIEQQKKDQDDMRKKQELADAQRKEEMKKKQEQAEAARKQEDLRKEALRKQQLEEKLRHEAIQRQNELDAQRKQQEMLRRQQEQEILRKQQQQQQQEQERLRKLEEQELLRKQQEQDRLRKQQEQERLRKQQEQELLRKQQEQERLRKQQEQERLRKQQEQELLRKQQEQERLRKQQEQESTSNVHFLQQQKQQIVVSSPNLNQGLKMSVNHGSSSSSTTSSSPSQMKLPSMPNTSVLVSSFGGSPTGLMSPQSPMYAQANNSLMMNNQQMQQQQPQANMSNSGNSGHIMVSSTNNVNNHHGYYSVHKQ
ncbi:hypothetical protein TCAL_11287 [Tigriopus californicus]|uniref:Hpc2-related domain-containing protein n=1 Tax=Tigriopus californicus TaxID=6832 RepID=A0A553P3C4_TIGCA|nr:hypothetical protein TCAL_11287 [Tigriopus californicus]